MKQSVLSFLVGVAGLATASHVFAPDSIEIAVANGLTDALHSNTEAVNSSPFSIFGIFLSGERLGKIHNLLCQNPGELELYERTEESPEHQRELYKYYGGAERKLHITVYNLRKLSCNSILAGSIFSQPDPRYFGNFVDPNLDERIISNIYQGLTSPNSGKSLEDCHSVANRMLKRALLKTAGAIETSRFFVPYLQVADFEDIRDLCNDTIASIFSINRPASVYSELQSWCSAMLQNPNMSVTYTQPLVFDVTESDCYKTKGFCNDDELREMMMTSFEPYFNLDNASSSDADFDKILKKKLSETDFNKIVLAFRRFATVRNRCFRQDLEMDRQILNALFTDETPRPLSLRNAAEKRLREADPDTIKALLEQCPSINMLLGYFQYGPPNFFTLYLEIEESEDRQIELYQFFLAGGYECHPNIFGLEKLEKNPILAGLIFLECNQENSMFWDAFPRVRNLLLLKRECDSSKEKGKEKESTNEANLDENNKAKYDIRQDMSVLCRFNFLSATVRNRILSDIYCMRRGKREIGKPLALAILKNLILHYRGKHRVAEKLIPFFRVVDAADLAQLYQKVFSGEVEVTPKSEFWRKHLKHLEENPRYVIVFVQPFIFNVSRHAFFEMEDCCTDADLRAILFKWTWTVDPREEDYYSHLLFRNLRFQKLVELLMTAGNVMDGCIDPRDKETWNVLDGLIKELPLTLEPSDLEAGPLEAVNLTRPTIPYFDFTDELVVKNLKSIVASNSEEQVIARIENRYVIMMIVSEYDKLPQGFLTDNFASDILSWVLELFVTKFPDHFLIPVLEQIQPDLDGKLWVAQLAKWCCKNYLYRQKCSLTRKDLLHEAVADLVMQGLGDTESIVRARIVAETAKITDPEAQQLIVEALMEYSNGTLLEMFQRVLVTPYVYLSVVQPRLFPVSKSWSLLSNQNVDSTLRMMGVTNRYILETLGQKPTYSRQILLELLIKHKKLLRWNFQGDWAILEKALIQNDPECYKAVGLDLNAREERLMEELPSFDCSQCVSFREVGIVVYRGIRSIFKERLKTEYAKEYQEGPLSQVAGYDLKVIVYNNHWAFEEISRQNQDYRTVITKAFLSKVEGRIPEGVRDELETKRASSVSAAISNWHRLYTKASLRLSMGFHEKETVQRCWLYVLLKNEISQGPNKKDYGECLGTVINAFLWLADPTIVKKIMKHHRSVDKLRAIFKASLRDPAAKIAMMQPGLKLKKPWSLAKLHKVIMKRVPNGAFRKRLMIAPTSFLFFAFRNHLQESMHLFNPKKSGDWKLLEREMLKVDHDCALAVMQIEDLPFIVSSLHVNCGLFNSYQEAFDSIKSKIQQ
jgi:hypothetical protein